MQDWLIAVISIAGSTAVTTVIGFLVKRMLDKYFAKKDKEEEDRRTILADAERIKEERLREERRQDVKQIVKEEIEPLNAKVDILTDKISKTEEGTLSSLRNDILTCYYRCLEKGYRGDWDYENIHHLYDAYFDLNGNSFITDVMNRFDALPTKEAYEKDLKKASKKKKTILKETK